MRKFDYDGIIENEMRHVRKVKKIQKNLLITRPNNLTLEYQNEGRSTSLKKTIKDNNLKYFSTHMSFYKNQKHESQDSKSENIKWVALGDFKSPEKIASKDESVIGNVVITVGDKRSKSNDNSKSKKNLTKTPSVKENVNDDIKLRLYFRDLAKSEKNNGAGESFQHKIQGKMLEEKKFIARKTTEQFFK